MITLYAFGTIFPEGRGETKDLRAQWALEDTCFGRAQMEVPDLFVDELRRGFRPIRTTLK